MWPVQASPAQVSASLAGRDEVLVAVRRSALIGCPVNRLPSSVRRGSFGPAAPGMLPMVAALPLQCVPKPLQRKGFRVKAAWHWPGWTVFALRR